MVRKPTRSLVRWVTEPSGATRLSVSTYMLGCSGSHGFTPSKRKATRWRFPEDSETDFCGDCWAAWLCRGLIEAASL